MRTTKFHLSGGVPPVANMPRAGNNSGLQPCAERKNASLVKLTGLPPAAAEWYSKERWRARFSATCQGRGNDRSTLLSLSGETEKARAAASHSARGLAKLGRRRPGRRISNEESG